MSSTSIYIRPNKEYSGVSKYHYSIPEYKNTPVFNYRYSPTKVSKGKVNSYGLKNENVSLYVKMDVNTNNSLHNKTHAHSADMSYIHTAKSTYSSVIYPIGADNINSSEPKVNIRRVNPYTPPADPFLPIGDIPLWFAIPFSIIAYIFINKSIAKKKSA